jgi:hypothetical protein
VDIQFFWHVSITSGVEVRLEKPMHPDECIGLIVGMFYLLLAEVFCCPAGFFAGIGFTGTDGLATVAAFDFIAALLTVR